jgi:hypothetical protein
MLGQLPVESGPFAIELLSEIAGELCSIGLVPTLCRAPAGRAGRQAHTSFVLAQFGVRGYIKLERYGTGSRRPKEKPEWAIGAGGHLSWQRRAR